MINFSSILKEEDSANLIKQYGYSTYSLEKGDVSFHEINNVHGSNANLTKQDSLFVVYRYESREATVDKAMKKNYDWCVQQHQKLVGTCEE